MKIHGSRYAATAAMASLMSSSVITALGEWPVPMKLVVAVFLAFFTGLICVSVVPYHDDGCNK